MTFTKGKSGNPGGRPKTDPKVKAMFDKRVPVAIKAIDAALAGDDIDVALKAAQIVFDRSMGKPLQSTEITGANAGPLVAVIKDA